MLHDQIPEKDATFTDPIYGVNLRASLEDLRAGESPLMQNCEFLGGVRPRFGSIALNGSSLGAYKILGGHRYYYGGASATAKRLIAFNNRISVLSDAGSETNLTTGMTAGLNTYFTTWPITDSCYISNETDTLRKYDGTTFSTVSGTNIPSPHSRVCPILDRLLAITTNGIERTDPRVDNVWSSNSSWATFRPQLPGLFTALHPISLRASDSFYTGALAFQERAFYLIQGTDFGAAPVTAASAPTGEDASISLLDESVGTASPYSICTVPGIGTLWLTTELNVYFLPEGSLKGQLIGDRLFSTGTTAGLESINKAQLSQAWMVYLNQRVILGIPVGSDTYATTQWWLDVNSYRQYPDRGPVWYGPMIGQSVGRAWVEDQQGEARTMGGEGNSSTGAFVYELRVSGETTDAVGTSTSDIEVSYQTSFKDHGVPWRQKYTQDVILDMTPYSGDVTIDIYDLDGPIATGLTVEQF